MIQRNESKRLRNIRQHGVDFRDCTSIFDAPLITKEDVRDSYGEQRLQSLGLLRGEVVFMVWTERETGPQLISIRKAEKYEQRYYIDNIQQLGF